MKTLRFLLMCSTLPLVSQAASGGSWCYDSQDPKCGPAHWKDIAKGCSGDAQSPIDIDRTQVRRDGALGPLLFQNYDRAPPGRWRLLNNGHTVMLSLEGALGMPQIAGAGLSDPYRALQLHFHWGSATGDGSEHTVDGLRHPMEMHVVHVNARYRNLEEAKGQRDGLAVLGFLFRVADTDNANYSHIVAGLKNVSHRGDSVDLASTFRLDQLLPGPAHLSRYYRYTGSLTTPDCSQNVLWTVFEEPVSIGRLQLDLFVSTALSSARGDPPVRIIDNFRPTQPRRGRPVLASRDATVSAAPPSPPQPQSLPLPLLSALLGLRLMLDS